jgi:hypothetical protein
LVSVDTGDPWVDLLVFLIAIVAIVVAYRLIRK